MDDIGLALVCGILASTMVALVFGLVGLLRPGPFLIAAAVATYSLVALWRMDAVAGTSPSPVDWGQVAGGFAAVAVAVAVAVSIGMSAEPRPLLDGYEAASAAVAESASRTGSLDNDVGFIAEDAPVTVGGPGLLIDGGKWTVAGPRGSAALLAVGRWLGADGGPRVFAALSGVLIVVIYLLALQRMRPVTSVVVATAVGLNPVLWLSAHGLNAAVPAAVLTVGGMWLLVRAASDGRIIQGAIAGGAIGSGALVVFGGWFLPVAAAAFLLVEESGSWHDSLTLRRRSRRFAGAVLGGAAMALLIAGWDAAATGRLGNIMVRVAPALAIVVAAGFAMRLLWTSGVRPDARRMRETALVLAVVLAAGAVYRLVRDPAGVAVVRDTALRLAAGDAVDTLDTGTSRFLVFAWLRQHAGLVTLLVGSTGLVWMGLAGVRTRDPGLRVPMIATLVAGGATMAMPLVVPVQPDGLGVLLPVVLPGLLLGAGFLIDRWWDRNMAGALGALVMAGALLFVPALRIADVAGSLPQAGAVDGVEDICFTLPPDAAVLVIAGGDAPGLGRLLGPAIRASCSVPAAHATTDLSLDDFDRFRRLAGDAGKSLYLVAGEPFPLGEDGPVVPKTGEVSYVGWIPTITSYPDRTEVVTWPIGVVIAE